MAINNTISNGLGATSPRISKPEPLTGFSVSEFKSHILKNGIMKSNLYLVNFQQAPWPKDLMFFTENVNIPAVDLDSQAIRRYGYGPVEQVAFHPVFTPMSMSFIVEAKQQNILSIVMDSISRISPFMGYNSMSTGGTKMYGGALQAYPYEVAYKKDYEFNLEVYVYNEQQDKIMIYTFRDCYAKQVGGIQLGWGNNDAYVKADVTFAYTDYSINEIDSISGGGSSTILNGLTSTLGLASLSETFNAIKNPASVADSLNLSAGKSVTSAIKNIG